jgi:selenocysteine-specific translation elongation factor
MAHAQTKSFQFQFTQDGQTAAQGKRVAVALHGVKTWMGIEKGPGFLAHAVSAVQKHVGVTAITLKNGRQKVIRLIHMRIGHDRDNHEAPLRANG